ncbi:MAG: restriction endonuclease subunit S [Melioribacteraceae bacterium]
MVSRRIYCNEYTPLLRELINKVNKSKSKFISPLSDYCYFNPKIELPQFNDYDIVSFIPMEVVRELTGKVEIKTAYYKDVAKGFTKFAEGDLIWAKITPCMQNGKSAIAKGLIKGVGFGSTEFHVIRPKDDSVNIEFIREILTLEETLNAFQGAFTGSAGQQRVPVDFLSEFRFPIPPRKVQDNFVDTLKIARNQKLFKEKLAEEILNGLDSYILDKLDLTLPEKSNISSYAITKSILNNRIDSYSNQSHFRKLFNKLSEKKYNTHTIKSVSDRIISGSTPLSGGDAYTQSPNGIRFIRSGEITSDGSVTAKSENHIKEEIHYNSLQRSQLKKNDVLIAIVGATIGQVGIFEFEEEANINQAIAAISISDPEVLPQYLCWYLKSSLGQMILDYFKRPVARANINLEEISQIPVIIPKKEIQIEIINEVTHRKEEAIRLKIEAETEWQNAKKWFEEQLLEGAK